MGYTNKKIRKIPIQMTRYFTRFLNRIIPLWKSKSEPTIEPYSETVLERIERVKMGVSIEEAQEKERISKLPLLDRIHYLKAKQSETKTAPVFGHIDTSKIPEINLLETKK